MTPEDQDAAVGILRAAYVNARDHGWPEQDVILAAIQAEDGELDDDPILDVWFRLIRDGVHIPELTQIIQRSRVWPPWSNDPDENLAAMPPRGLLGTLLVILTSPSNPDQAVAATADTLNCIATELVRAAQPWPGGVATQAAEDFEHLWRRVGQLLRSGREGFGLTCPNTDKLLSALEPRIPAVPPAPLVPASPPQATRAQPRRPRRVVMDGGITSESLLHFASAMIHLFTGD